MKKIFLLFMGLVLFSDYAFAEKKISLTSYDVLDPESQNQIPINATQSSTAIDILFLKGSVYKVIVIGAEGVVYPLERVLSESECRTVSLLHDSIVGIALNAVTNYSSRGIYDPIDDLSTDVKHIVNYNSYGVPLISNDIQLDLINQVDGTLIDFYKSNNYAKALNSFVEEGIISIDSERIMDLFFQAVNESVADEQDLDVILSEYRMIVSDSPNLSLEDKNSLLIAFTIMKSSFNYWKTKI